MSRRAPISFRLRTALFIAVAFTLLLSAFFVVSYISIEQTLTTRRDNEVTTALDEILSGLRSPVTQALFDSLYRNHSATGESAIAVRLVSSDPSDSRITTRGPGRVASTLDSIPVPTNDAPFDLESDQLTIRIIARSAREFRLIAATDKLPLEEVQDAMTSRFLILLGAGIAVSLLVGLLTANLALKPLKVLIASALAIRSHSRTDDSLPTDTQTAEINDLARLINDVLAERDRNIAALRTFTADAAHELRTPLTILKGELEVDLRTKQLGDSERESIESNLEEVARLIRIVEDLLTLARLDREETDGTQTESPWSPSALVQECIDRYDPVVVQKRLRLGTSLSATGMCVVSRDDVRTIVTNLLENAIRYSPPDGEIELTTADATDNGIVIRIADRGIGIAAADLPHIFDRFWRADRARTRSAGGTGLGLTIAKRLADKHHIVLSVESEAGNGTVAVCHVPGVGSAQ